MVFTLKSKIWLTVFSVVLMFTFFTLIYFPSEQRKQLTESYSAEVQNLAKSVAIGVEIAMEEYNLDAVDSAMKLVTEDPRTEFLIVHKFDTIWDEVHNKFQFKDVIISSFPKKTNLPFIKSVTSGDSLHFIDTDAKIITKKAAYTTPGMSGYIILAFSTKQIAASQKRIENMSLLVSGIVTLIGILLGFLLSKKISVPVLALRDAAIKVGEGDLSQKVNKISKDEIGELGKAFNKMVDDLSRARTELDEKNRTLSDTNSKLNTALDELKATQGQLIHAEKMASLGELTAGIAHEIQNPLNFVNNFSEVSSELLDEMKNELDKGNYSEAIEISNDVKQNLEKISHHGKRADAIVKGMLQHSRSSNAVKEPTDINALADEYLRLSYHGLRAKDKTFNAAMKTEFDSTLEKVNIIPQDVGRVILNLLTNAFYAVNEKKKLGISGYDPTVTVSTGRSGKYVEICVADNGMGIPQKILEKIFQPFFTTKPAGQGTGLGLSLSFEIINKGHGGEMKVETKEGEGTRFIIHLPA